MTARFGDAVLWNEVRPSAIQSGWRDFVLRDGLAGAFRRLDFSWALGPNAR
jgi:hypothetical protein